MALVTKTFSDIITFTRASTATYFDSAGVLTSAGNNVPRLDYNPATLAAQGLLIEEQRTNSLTYSEQFDNAAWTKQSTVSVAANTTLAPDGTTSGDTVTADSGLGVYQSATATIGVTYCQSVFIKAGTATAILFRDDTGAGRSITINPSTGAITATGGTLVTSGSQAIGNGWWRYWFAYVADTTTVRGIIRPDSAGAGQTFIVWGAQTEVGAFPTSYIPTTTTALTRSEDVASVNTLSPWYNASQGTLYAEAQSLRPGTDTTRIVALSDNTANNSIRLNAASTTNSVVTLGANEATYTLAYTVGAVNKWAIAYASNDANGAVNGVTGTTDTTVAIPVVDRLEIGRLANGASGSKLVGYLRRITYYPRRLANAELVSITS